MDWLRRPARGFLALLMLVLVLGSPVAMLYGAYKLWGPTGPGVAIALVVGYFVCYAIGKDMEDS